MDLEKNSEAHHKHLHAVDLTLCCLPRSVIVGQSGRMQTNQKHGFENHNTIVFLIIFYGQQYEKFF